MITTISNKENLILNKKVNKFLQLKICLVKRKIIIYHNIANFPTNNNKLSGKTTIPWT